MIVEACDSSRPASGSEAPTPRCSPSARGRVDPALVYDTTTAQDPPDQLPFRDPVDQGPGHRTSAHQHADAVSVTSPGPVEPARLLELLKHPPPHGYRIKATSASPPPEDTAATSSTLIARTVHIHPAPAITHTSSSLVAIGIGLDTAAVHRRLHHALTPTRRASDRGYRDLRRYCTPRR